MQVDIHWMENSTWNVLTCNQRPERYVIFDPSARFKVLPDFAPYYSQIRFHMRILTEKSYQLKRAGLK